MIAEELVRIDDERLAFVTITAIDVDNELNRAIVYFDSLAGEDGDADDRRGARRAPAPASRRRSTARSGPRRRRSSQFRPDEVIRSAERIDDILRADRRPRRRRRALSRWLRPARPPTVHGLAVVDKPAGVTSHDVVGMLRRRFGERRVGHAGTLDPDATGVLVVGVGKATRLLRFVADGRKPYTGEVVLGVETDTLDAAGAVTATHDMSAVDRRRCPARSSPST